VDPGPEALGARVDARCRAMLDAGLLREVRELRARGFGPRLRPLQAIGYRHMHPVVEGSDTLENALAAMQRDTRRLARRQRTWLRSVRGAEWVAPEESARIRELAERFLHRAAGAAQNAWAV
jgi:tRNA dimethylallyltransferase